MMLLVKTEAGRRGQESYRPEGDSHNDATTSDRVRPCYQLVGAVRIEVYRGNRGGRPQRTATRLTAMRPSHQAHFDLVVALVRSVLAVMGVPVVAPNPNDIPQTSMMVGDMIGLRDYLVVESPELGIVLDVGGSGAI